MNNKITEDMLFGLRLAAGERMSEKRYRHTLEVEKMAARLGEIYVPEDVDMLRAAALLHDITKELTVEEHFKILRDHGIEVTDADRLSPKTLHARTAALVIPERYPELDIPDLISAVRYHTTGREAMTVYEKIIYLADYIDMSRTFSDCVELRNYFFSPYIDLASASEEEKMAHLDRTLILSYDMTIRGLLDGGRFISEDTFGARNYLISHIK